MRFNYTTEKITTIIKHEDEMLKKYFEIVKGYSTAFEQYNCILKVGLGWSNSLKKDNTENRLPFDNGYECYVYCDVERNGRLIRYKATDGEEVYYEMSASWLISSISRSFFRLKANLYEDTYTIIEEIEPLLEIISTI